MRQPVAWDAAVARWRALPSHEGAAYDRTIVIDGEALEPMVTYGTNPGVATAHEEHRPDGSQSRMAESDASRAGGSPHSVPRGHETIRRFARSWSSVTGDNGGE